MATKYSQLPAAILDEDHELSSLARYLLNKVVTWFGITIENALAERVNVGSEKEPHMEARYTLSQLLDPSFRLPRPMNATAARKQVGSHVKALFGSGKPKHKGKSGSPQGAKVSPLLQMWLEKRGGKVT
jgi:hypothetical protein